jgi:ribonuclease HI
VAAWIAVENGKRVAQGYRRCIGTNQVGGEVIAAKDSLVWATKQKYQAINIYPDCLNVSEGLQGRIEIYAERGWKIKNQRSKHEMDIIKKRGLQISRRDMLNKEAWQDLFDAYQQVKHILICTRIPSHSGNYWNNEADKLAKNQFNNWKKIGFATQVKINEA